MKHFCFNLLQVFCAHCIVKHLLLSDRHLFCLLINLLHFFENTCIVSCKQGLKQESLFKIVIILFIYLFILSREMTSEDLKLKERALKDHYGPGKTLPKVM